jgi:hypothetical protein
MIHGDSMFYRAPQLLPTRLWGSFLFYDKNDKNTKTSAAVFLGINLNMNELPVVVTVVD